MKERQKKAEIQDNILGNPIKKKKKKCEQTKKAMFIDCYAGHMQIVKPQRKGQGLGRGGGGGVRGGGLSCKPDAAEELVSIIVPDLSGDYQTGPRRNNNVRRHS